MTVHGDRVCLRELQVSDLPDIHAYSQLPEVCRYQPWGPNTSEQTRAFVEETLAAASASPRMLYAFAVVFLEIGQVIGLSSLTIRSLVYRTGEIGYVLHSGYWGRGLGTEVG